MTQRNLKFSFALFFGKFLIDIGSKKGEKNLYVFSEKTSEINKLLSRMFIIESCTENWQYSQQCFKRFYGFSIFQMKSACSSLFFQVHLAPLLIGISQVTEPGECFRQTILEFGILDFVKFVCFFKKTGFSRLI